MRPGKVDSLLKRANQLHVGRFVHMAMTLDLEKGGKFSSETLPHRNLYFHSPAVNTTSQLLFRARGIVMTCYLFFEEPMKNFHS